MNLNEASFAVHLYTYALTAGCTIKTFAYIDMLQTEKDFKRCEYEQCI